MDYKNTTLDLFLAIKESSTNIGSFMENINNIIMKSDGSELSSELNELLTI